MKTDRLSWTERICYGAGSMGPKLIFGAITGYFLIYLTNVAMLDIAICSVIIGVSKFFDGISDVVVGNIIDNTVSRLGKARVWILRMCLPFALTGVMLFWVPSGLPQLLKYVYVFLMYNIVNTVMMTFMSISSYSMVSLLSSDRKEQVILSSIQAMTRAVGSLAATVAFVRLLDVFTDEPGNQNTQIAYTRSMVVIGALMIVLSLAAVIGTKERVQTAPERKKKSLAKDTLESLKLLITDKYWAVLLLVDIIMFVVYQFMASGATYYSLYVLKDMRLMSPILITAIVPTVLIMLFIPTLSGKFGKRKVILAGFVIAIIGLTGFGLVAPTITPMLMFNALYGLGSGLIKGTSIAFIADMVKYTEKEKGQFIAGTGNAGLSATEKLGNGLGSMIFGALLGAAGFDAALKVQPAAVENMVSMLFIWIPLALIVVALAIFAIFFDLEEEKQNENGYTSAE